MRKKRLVDLPAPLSTEDLFCRLGRARMRERWWRWQRILRTTSPQAVARGAFKMYEALEIAATEEADRLIEELLE